MMIAILTLVLISGEVGIAYYPNLEICTKALDRLIAQKLATEGECRLTYRPNSA